MQAKHGIGQSIGLATAATILALTTTLTYDLAFPAPSHAEDEVTLNPGRRRPSLC